MYAERNNIADIYKKEYLNYKVGNRSMWWLPFHSFNLSKLCGVLIKTCSYIEQLDQVKKFDKSDNTDVMDFIDSVENESFYTGYDGVENDDVRFYRCADEEIKLNEGVALHKTKIDYIESKARETINPFTILEECKRFRFVQSDRY